MTAAMIDPKSTSFPTLVHRMLTEIDELASNPEKDTHKLSKVVSWQPHGMAFLVHDKKKFAEIIMPKWFPRLKHASWIRQLSLFGFKRVHAEGDDKGAMYHESFIRGMPELAAKIQKVKRKKNNEDAISPSSSGLSLNTASLAFLQQKKDSNTNLTSFSSDVQAPLPVVSSSSLRDMVFHARRNTTLPCHTSSSSAIPQLPSLALSMSPQHQQETALQLRSFPRIEMPYMQEQPLKAASTSFFTEDVFSLLQRFTGLDEDSDALHQPLAVDEATWDLEPLPLH
ncbi:stress transcription factor A-3 [Seminavis robusta]|uniref:Stress transcription factor A-3 n=1 Tax=Seminavis robusta TaxID=568900 RepID=A0A9N8HRZ2_9STRA|nr:stress transcription factor A-3 [Seminavis robusta]|eukprot:Sro1120_g243330.1 stress transcription factor A-3 (283) ;mRNA; f:20059-20907